MLVLLLAENSACLFHISVIFFCGKAISWKETCLDWRNFFTGEKTPLVVGGTRTQVLVDSVIFAASALDHFATKTYPVCDIIWFYISKLLLSSVWVLCICFNTLYWYLSLYNACFISNWGVIIVFSTVSMHSLLPINSWQTAAANMDVVSQKPVFPTEVLQESEVSAGSSFPSCLMFFLYN